MPTIITRLYEDKETAQAALDKLHEAEHHAFNAEIVREKGNNKVSKKLRSYGLGSVAAKVYSKHMKEKNALAIIEAEFSPDGGTRRIIDILDSFPTIDVGLSNQERFVDDEKRDTTGKIISNTLFMTNPRRKLPSGHVSRGSLISRRKPGVSLMRGKSHASTKILPLPLLTKRTKKSSALKRKLQFSSLLRMPTTSSVRFRMKAK